jgi:DNA-binding MarR family transcriptional regulator/GNAT superfamily N-acetyltransferase
LAPVAAGFSEYCYEQMRQLYAALSIQFDPTWFAYISHLKQTGGSTVQQIADELGTSQPATTKMLHKLEAAELIQLSGTASDKRVRHVELSAKGHALWDHITPSLDIVNRILADLDQGKGVLDGLNHMEAACATLSLKQRILTAMGQSLPVRLVPYNTQLHDFYEQHNRAWVSKYFRMEPIDEATLGDPHTHVFPKGGEIYIVHVGDYPIGGFSLIPHEQRLELSKMYVPEALQGCGYGNLVIEQAIACARSKGAHTLFLMSNRILTPAISLYKKYGFEEIPLTPELAALYQRVNIVMEKPLQEQQRCATHAA